jgi:hypothetical protein
VLQPNKNGANQLMTEQTGGMRLFPALGAALIAVLVGCLALLLLRPAALTVSGGATANSPLADAHIAWSLAASAMRGEAKAFAGLATVSKQLKDADVSRLDDDTRRSLVRISASLGTIEAGRSELLALRAAADRLDRVVPRLAAQIDALQANPALRNQPATIAQLERIRALADGLRRDLRGLSQGAVKAAAQSSAMLDADMAITQVVRGLAEGNAELGLRALTGPEAIRALDGLRKESAELSKTLRDVLAAGDRLSALRQSMEQLDTLVGALPLTPVSTAQGPALGLAATIVAALLALGIALALAMIWIYRRVADTGRAAARQTAQNERNQQAILTLLDEMSQPRRRGPHRAGHGDRGHHRRDCRLGQLRDRGPARTGHDHQRLGDPARRRCPPDAGVLARHLACEPRSAVQADRLGLASPSPRWPRPSRRSRAMPSAPPTSPAIRWMSRTRAATRCAARSTA